MTLPGTPDWLAQRRQFVGASELAAIVGRDPYRSEFELALAKKGLGEERSSWPMTWGNRVQRLALEVYSEVTGRKVRNVSRTATNKRWPHVKATLDGRVVGEPVGVEAKWTARTIHEVPEHWRLQVQGQMGICDLSAVDIIRLSGRDEPAIWTVERDDALILDLLDMAEAWYVRYVEGDELPPVDGSRGASRYLDSLPAEDIPMVASDEQAELVTTLRQIRKALDVFELDDKKLVNQLKESMFGAYGLRGPGFRITWKPTKERTTTDWKAVAAVYRDELLSLQRAVMGDTSEAVTAYDAIEFAHTTTGEGTRPFRVSWTEEES